VTEQNPTVRIDWIACNAYGVCALVAPDLFGLDDWGYPLVDTDQPVPDELVRQARRSESRCPMLAISLETNSGLGRR
jgi:ferredoxin